MLYVPVNSHGHVGTLPLFYGTFTENGVVMTSSINIQIETAMDQTYGWIDLNHFFPTQAQTKEVSWSVSNVNTSSPSDHIERDIADDLG